MKGVKEMYCIKSYKSYIHGFATNFNKINNLFCEMIMKYIKCQ